MSINPQGQTEESSPLLREPRASDDIDNDDHGRQRQRRQTLILVCISIVAADFGNFLSYAPQLAIFESLICKQQNNGRDALASLISNATLSCKDPQVQGELAIINGWKDTFDQVPGIALAIPYGFMADRIGRKPTLLLSLVGLMLEELAVCLVCFWNPVIPLRSVWAAPVFQLLGGGPQVANAMAYAIVSDIYPAHERASVFFLMAAAILLGEILATPLSAFLMSWTPWIPFQAGLICQLTGFVATTALLETRPKQVEDTSRSRNNEPVDGFVGSDSDSELRATAPRKTVLQRLWRKLRSYNTISLNMVFIFGAFFLASIGRQSLQLIIQYASKRFSWSIPRASSLITLKGIINLVILLVILPRISLSLSKRMTAAQKDLRIVQASIWILAIGMILMALAAHPALFIAGVCGLALGWGFYSALRSLAMTIAEPEDIGVVSTAIGFAQSIGIMIAGPVLATAFRRGIELNGMWIGLPYMAASALLIGAGVLMTFGVKV